MASQNPLNVYKGADSIRDYHDPEKAPLLPLVELPSHVNSYHSHGVRIYAKMMTALPAHNVKALPALNLLRQHKRPETETIVEYSSGSTVVSLAILSRVLYGVTDTWAYVSNKTQLTKLRLLQFFGLKIKLFGGPSTPDPDDVRGGIYAAGHAQAENNKVLNPNQYVRDANWNAHFLWTGPQILKQLPEINVFCAAMGTTGTLSGVGSYLKQSKPSIRCLGVCIAPGNEVPGPRMLSMIQKIEFPWRQMVDAIEEVDTQDSYATSMDLSRAGIIGGPSSGLGYKGLTRYLDKKLSEQALDGLRGPDGLVHCVFMCCDLPYIYLDEYSRILGSSHFAPVVNEKLLDVDKYTYDARWELSPQQCHEKMGIDIRDLQQETPSTRQCAEEPIRIIDLRCAKDFEARHIRGSVNMPLDSLASDSPSPFESADVLERQWKELYAKFSENDCGALGFAPMSRWEDVLMICYSGDTARVATSILRKKDIQAFSLGGGFQELAH